MPHAHDTVVLVVDDDKRTRDALELIIDARPGMVCARTFDSVEALLEEHVGPAIDVVLLDINLPGRSGIEGIAPIRRAFAGADVIMLTIYDDDDVVFDALCQGASGYLLKNTPPDEILDAICDVRSGGAPMTASVARKVVRFFRKPKIRVDGLSERERAVLEHLVDGKTNQQIADNLYISTNTVAFHLKQIYEKLHVHTRAAAVARVMRGED